MLGYDNSGSAVNSCSNINFSNLNVLIPAGTQTLTMQLWDLDENDVFHLYSNQDISNYPLNISLGQYQFSDNNAYGYVQFDTVPGTTVTETLNVIVNPTPRIPNVTASVDSFCSADSVLISVDSASFYPGFNYQWYRDTVFLVNASDSAFYTNRPGKYRVEITNPLTGCVAKSATKTVSSFASPGNPGLGYSNGQVFINPLVSGFGANWYYDSNLVTGHNGDVLNYIGPGVYNAQIYNLADPACSVYLSPITVTASAIQEVNNNAISGLVLSPNPNSGIFRLQFSSPQQQAIHISIESMIGQVVYTRNLDNFSGNYNQQVDLSELSKGVYMVFIETAAGRQNRKIVVQ